MEHTGSPTRPTFGLLRRLSMENSGDVDIDGDDYLDIEAALREAGIEVVAEEREGAEGGGGDGSDDDDTLLGECQIAIAMHARAHAGRCRFLGLLLVAPEGLPSAGGLRRSPLKCSYA